MNWLSIQYKIATYQQNYEQAVNCAAAKNEISFALTNTKPQAAQKLRSSSHNKEETA